MHLINKLIFIGLTSILSTNTYAAINEEHDYTPSSSASAGDSNTVIVQVTNCTGRDIKDLRVPYMSNLNYIHGYDTLNASYNAISQGLKEVGDVDNINNLAGSISYSYQGVEDSSKTYSGQLRLMGNPSFQWNTVDHVDFTTRVSSNAFYVTVKLTPQQSDQHGTIYLNNNEAGVTIPDQLGTYPRITINPEYKGSSPPVDIPSACQDFKPRQWIELPMSNNFSASDIYVGDKVEFMFPFAGGKRSSIVCSYRWQKDNRDATIDCDGSDDENIAMRFDHSGTHIQAYCIGKSCPKLVS